MSASVPTSSSGCCEPDPTVQAFARWLTELKARNARALGETLREAADIRDGIAAGGAALAEHRRESATDADRLRRQLQELQEKLTCAYGEITSLVTQKSESDKEMMQDILGLQQHLSTRAAELEALKKSYGQAQAQLQSSVVEVQNHLRVTCEEVCAARACSEEAYQSMAKRFNQIDENVRALEVELGAGTGEGKRQLGQVQGELAKIHESLAQVAGDLQEHRRASCAAHHRLLAQLSGLQGAGWSSPPCPAGGSPPPAVTSCTVSPARSMEAPSHGPPAGWQLGSPGTPVALPAPAAGSIAVQSTAESGRGRSPSPQPPAAASRQTTLVVPTPAQFQAHQPPAPQQQPQLRPAPAAAQVLGHLHQSSPAQARSRPPQVILLQPGQQPPQAQPGSGPQQPGQQQQLQRVVLAQPQPPPQQQPPPQASAAPGSGPSSCSSLQQLAQPVPQQAAPAEPSARQRPAQPPPQPPGGASCTAPPLQVGCGSAHAAPAAAVVAHTAPGAVVGGTPQLTTLTVVQAVGASARLPAVAAASGAAGAGAPALVAAGSPQAPPAAQTQTVR